MAPTEHDIRIVLACIDYRWYVIGLALNIERRVLERLRMKLEYDIVKLSDVIHNWITTAEPRLITWKTVIAAIEGPIVNNKQTANIIRDYLTELERGKL